MIKMANRPAISDFFRRAFAIDFLGGRGGQKGTLYPDNNE